VGFGLAPPEQEQHHRARQAGPEAGVALSLPGWPCRATGMRGRRTRRCARSLEEEGLGQRDGQGGIGRWGLCRNSGAPQHRFSIAHTTSAEAGLCTQGCTAGPLCFPLEPGDLILRPCPLSQGKAPPPLKASQ